MYDNAGDGQKEKQVRTECDRPDSVKGREKLRIDRKEIGR